jgi:hypothetical protein
MPPSTGERENHPLWRSDFAHKDSQRVNAPTDLYGIVPFVSCIFDDHRPAYCDELAFIGTPHLFRRPSNPDLCESGAIYCVLDACCYNGAACRYAIGVKLSGHWLA